MKLSSPGRRSAASSPRDHASRSTAMGKLDRQDRDRHRRRAGHRPGHRREARRRGRHRRRHRHQRGDRQGDRRGDRRRRRRHPHRRHLARVGRGDGRAGARSSSAGSTCWSTTPAGTRPGPFVDSDPADWDRVIAINLYGVLTPARRCCRSWPSRASGSVVNLASDAGRVGSSGEAVYSAAKGGVIAFTKAIAREMARHQVNANCVCPGPDRHRAVRLDGRRQPEAARGPDQGHPVPAARRSPPTSPTRSRSSPPTRPPTSPARPSASAAASR